MQRWQPRRPGQLRPKFGGPFHSYTQGGPLLCRKLSQQRSWGEDTERTIVWLVEFGWLIMHLHFGVRGASYQQPGTRSTVDSSVCKGWVHGQGRDPVLRDSQVGWFCQCQCHTCQSHVAEERRGRENVSSYKTKWCERTFARHPS